MVNKLKKCCRGENKKQRQEVEETERKKKKKFLRKCTCRQRRKESKTISKHLLQKSLFQDYGTSGLVTVVV